MLTKFFPLKSNRTGTSGSRRVVLNYRIEDGTSSKDPKVIPKQNLKPLESELLRIEQIAMHVSAESDHQREREATHRDTSGALFLNNDLLLLHDISILSLIIFFFFFYISNQIGSSILKK